MCALAALITALALAPFYNGIHSDLYALCCITLCAGLGCAVWRRAAAPRVPVGPAGATLALLLAWALLSQSWSVVTYLTSIQAGIIGAALVAYLLSSMLTDDSRARSMAAAGLASVGNVFALAMLAQLALGQKPEGSFLNVNSAGAFLNLLWPLPAAVALAARNQRGFVASVVSAGIMVFAAGVTGGRAVTLALAAAFAAVVLGSWAWTDRRRLVVLGTVLLGALIVAQAVSQAMPQGSGRNLGDRMVTLADPGTAGESRFRIWEATWTMIGDRPWLGWGPGTFFQAYPAYRAPDDGSAGQHAHNDFLQYWVEGGLPALALLVALFGICAYLFVRSAIRPQAAPAERAMVVAGGAAIAGAGIHALFSYNLQLLPMQILFGLAVGALEVGSGARPWLRIPLERIRTRPLPAVAFVGLLALPVVHLGTVAGSAHYTNEGASALAAGNVEKADEAFATATRLWPAQDLAHGIWADLYRQAMAPVPEGDVERRRELKRRGLELAEQAINRNPLRPLHQLTKGRILVQPPDAAPRAAEQAFRRALELDPRAASARVALARMLLDQGREEEALATVNGGFGYKYTQNNPLGLMHLGIKLRAQAGDHAGAERLREQVRALETDSASGRSAAAAAAKPTGAE